MEPSQIADQLRRIATAIDNSNKPDKKLVAEALSNVIAAIDSNREKRMTSMIASSFKEIRNKLDNSIDEFVTAVEVEETIAEKSMNGSMRGAADSLEDSLMAAVNAFDLFEKTMTSVNKNWSDKSLSAND